MSTRRVEYTGQATVLYYDDQNVISQKLTELFRAHGWNVIAIVGTYASSGSSTLNLSTAFNVDTSISPHDAYKAFLDIINIFTQNYLYNNGDYNLNLSNYYFDVTDHLDTSYANTTSSNTPKTVNAGVIATVNVPYNSGNTTDFIDTLATQLKMSRQTVILILGLGGVLLLVKLAHD